jgi:hypothetical protein
MMLAYYIFNILLNFDTIASSATLLFKLEMPTTAFIATPAATGERQVQIRRWLLTTLAVIKRIRGL